MPKPLGTAALALFFVFGMLMSFISGLMLIFPDSPLEQLWNLNPRAREGFTELGIWAILLMFIVSVACGTAALGLWLLRCWGQRSALIILTINSFADTGRALLFHDYRTLVGVPIAAVMIGYLIKRRSVFT